MVERFLFERVFSYFILISFILISPCRKFDHPSGLLVPFGSFAPFHWRYCRWMSQVTFWFLGVVVRYKWGSEKCWILYLKYRSEIVHVM